MSDQEAEADKAAEEAACASIDQEPQPEPEAELEAEVQVDSESDQEQEQETEQDEALFWAHPSNEPAHRTLTKHSNRSSPALGKTKPLKQAAPPLPTADDLQLDKLKLIDQSFTPPVRNHATPSQTAHPQPTPPRRDSANSQRSMPIKLGDSGHNSQIIELYEADERPVSSSSLPIMARADDTDREDEGYGGMASARPESLIEALHLSDQPPAQPQPQPQQPQPQASQRHAGQGAIHDRYIDPTANTALYRPPPPVSYQQQPYPPNHHVLAYPAFSHPPPHHQINHSTSSAFSNNNQAYASSSSQPRGIPPSASLGALPASNYYNSTQPQYYPLAPPPNHLGLPPQMSQHYAPPPTPYAPGPSGYLDAYAPQPPQRPYANPQILGSSLTRSGTSMSSLSSSRTLINNNHHPPHPSRSSTGTAVKSGPTITKASIDEYRNRIKSDPDPEAHFNYAKFLIEAAKKLAQGGAAGDDKAIKKYRDALLSESLKLIKKLATQGVGLGKPAYSDAQFFLANCLGNGSLGLGVDHEKAYNLYVQASKQNHPASTYRTAVCNELGAGTRKDPNRALLFYRKASALGDTAGMYKLGMILLNGLLGQQRNPQEALLWLKRAAQQADEDNPHALHELAQIYEKPPVVSTNPPVLLLQRDEAYARELYTQSAQLGYPPSQNKLGSAYEYGGLGCGIDPRRSIGWYTKAAEKGDAESELALSGWYLTGYEGVLKQSDSEAYLWARRAANKGLPKAEYAVGYYSEVGIGVKMDLDEAKRWYMRAATNKNKRAMQRLTELKKLGAQKPGKKQARPTRDQAASECVIS